MTDPFIKTTFTGEAIEDAAAALVEIQNYDIARAGWGATDEEVTDDIIRKLEYLTQHLKGIRRGEEEAEEVKIGVAGMFHTLEPVLMDLYNKRAKIQGWIDTLSDCSDPEEFQRILEEIEND